MGKRHPIVLELGKVNDNATTFDLITERWKAGYLFCFQRFAFRIATNAPTQVDVGVRRAGRDFWLETFASVVANDIDGFYPEVWIPSDYQIIVRVSGGTVGNLCEAWIYGYIEPEVGP